VEDIGKAIAGMQYVREIQGYGPALQIGYTYKPYLDMTCWKQPTNDPQPTPLPQTPPEYEFPEE
jgi:hypothetical protein